VNLVKHFEQGPNGGYADKVYICHAGKPTIGYGHVVLPGENFNQPMTEQEANDLLMEDLNKFSVQVERLLKVNVSQDQFDALVSLAFNTGVGKASGINGDFADSILMAYVNYGKFQLAAAEFSKWVYNVGKVLPCLVRRRKAETLLFSTGVFFAGTPS
jgi:lysozyme